MCVSRLLIPLYACQTSHIKLLRYGNLIQQGNFKKLLLRSFIGIALFFKCSCCGRDESLVIPNIGNNILCKSNKLKINRVLLLLYASLRYEYF